MADLSGRMPANLVTLTRRSQYSVAPILSPRSSVEIVWEAHLADDGRRFYHNVLLGQSVWERPSVPGVRIVDS